MQDVTELQRRITAALGRIGAGLDKLDAARPDPEPADEGPSPELLAAQGELESERALNAQLQERIQANRDRSEAQEEKLRAELEELRTLLRKTEEDRAQLKAVNDALRDSNAALREANEKAMGDDSLVNTALQTELDALRQVRASDRAELDAIVRLLEPALSETTATEEAAHNA
ncbi:hypothetical protein SAMN04488012_10143 [Palleronia salina]|uniref:Colicin import membrane protein n=1 Tax=Palleronia salina TaxID=313368 RepID=A0A1M6AAG5_9RHOB|nr:hypothetical protein [Palleronia salina]SHI33163.1 hypothetical protein SAMN04488012_10143 [Palleronia salina]